MPKRIYLLLDYLAAGAAMARVHGRAACGSRQVNGARRNRRGVQKIAGSETWTRASQWLAREGQHRAGTAPTWRPSKIADGDCRSLLHGRADEADQRIAVPALIASRGVDHLAIGRGCVRSTLARPTASIWPGGPSF